LKVKESGEKIKKNVEIPTFKMANISGMQEKIPLIL
jgi:hypothetical protein